MRAVLQRVCEASVKVDAQISGAIKQGLVVLLGINHTDTSQICDKILAKIINLRIFADGNGKMNLSLLDIGGEMLIISQFTLCADCRKGRRPSYNMAMPPTKANELYEYFLAQAKKTSIGIAAGIFQAEMQVALTNDGPVTIVLDSENI